MAKTLPELRVQIDAVDRELLELLNRRAALANEVGDIKRVEGSPVFRPEREAQVIHGLKTANAGPLKGDSVAHDLARNHVGLPCPGGPAARGLPRPGRHLQRAGCPGLLRHQHRARALYQHRRGVSRHQPPAPPTSAWCRWRTPPKAWSLDRWTCSSSRRCSSSARPACYVRHNLLRKTPSLDGIEAVLAHPQALAQCQGWLNTICPRPSAAPSPATPKAPAWPR
jgi:chorismate mutase/prephenate dehydratase